MSKRNRISEDDKTIFADWVKDVRPLKKGQDKVFSQRVNKQQKKNTNPTEQVTQATTWSDVQFSEQMMSAADQSQVRSGGVQKQLFRKLKQGKIPIEARLDLHNNTVNQARARIEEFLLQSRYNHLRCVIIIHGKGQHNQQGKAILKSMVHHWLQQAPEVLAFSSALPQDGGTGAIYVLLKRVKE